MNETRGPQRRVFTTKPRVNVASNSRGACDRTIGQVQGKIGFYGCLTNFLPAPVAEDQMAVTPHRCIQRFAPAVPRSLCGPTNSTAAAIFSVTVSACIAVPARYES